MKNQKIKSNNKTSTFYFLLPKFCFLFLLSIFYFLNSVEVSAASLTFSPLSGTYTNGSSIIVSVLVSSSDKTMNAASGVISFPTNLLSVSSISKSGSIVDFWAQEPSFSNTSGTVTFESVLLPPGFQGGSGKILTITFKAKALGTANIAFNSGSVLAADGVGTNILTSSNAAALKISAAAQVAPTVVTPPTNIANIKVPGAEVITSATHPDSTKWYAVNDAIFSWTIAKGILANKVLIGRAEKSAPTVSYIPAITSKEVKNLDDGVWYFHLQFKNDSGWGAVSDFKLQIDTEKPTSLSITEIKRKDLTNPKTKFTFHAADKTSGIDYYEVAIDNGSSVIWKDDGKTAYETQAQKGGNHTILVKAFDKAGNFILSSTQFSVEALQSPRISDYPKEVKSEEAFTIKGVTRYPNSGVTLYLQDENGMVKTYTSKANEDGNFIASSGLLKDGIYTAWVEITDNRGATSAPSERVFMSVIQPTLIRIGSTAVNYLLILIPLLALVLVLGFMLWFAWHRFFVMKKKLNKEVREAEDVLHKAFDALREGTDDQTKKLKKTKSKRKLISEDEKINKQFKEDLEGAEKFIKKEVDDIDELLNK